MTISEIRDILKQETVEKTVLEEIMADERKGVRQLVDAYIRRLNRQNGSVWKICTNRKVLFTKKDWSMLPELTR